MRESVLGSVARYRAESVIPERSNRRVLYCAVLCEARLYIGRTNNVRFTITGKLPFYD